MKTSLYFLLLLLQCTLFAANIRFLSIADIHFGTNNKPGMGQDTGPLQWQAAVKKFHQLSQKTDFSLLLGDLPTHGFLSQATKNKYERAVFHDLYLANDGNKPMFYIPGNNDSLGGNYHPFSYYGHTPLQNAPEWQGACMHCADLLIDDSHMRDEGYYSTYVLPGNKDIILIVLNSVQFAKHSAWLPSPYPTQHQDASEQLQWFAQQLEANHGKQLLIAMHIAPGLDYLNHPLWDKPYLDGFIAALNHFSKHFQQITLLTAHSHYDELRKISLDNGQIIFSYGIPGISRSHYNHSAMKIIELDKEASIANFTTYYMLTGTVWNDDHYTAIGENNSIFPMCSGKTLSQCLAFLSPEEVCKNWEEKEIYGVKSKTIATLNCAKLYPIY